MDRYVPLEKIGKGSFGIVQKVKRLSDDKVLVWKAINYQSMTSREKHQLVTEVNLLKSLDHPNIVKYYDRIVDKKTSTVYIIMEYCAGGDMGTQLKQSKKSGQPLPEEVIWKICYQLVLALDYCHSRPASEEGGKVLHRDIKPANIFIDENNHIRLGDFGLSREMGEHSQFAQTHVGTPYYMSPQQVKNQKYNQKSDIWSAGCLLYEMAALRRPFQANNQLALASKISTGQYERIPYRYSQQLFDLIKNMLNINAQQRWSGKKILMKTPLFVMRTNENLLKERISALRQRETAIKLKEREIEQMRKGMINCNKEVMSLQTQAVLMRKKSSRQGQKENRNLQNVQNK